MPMFHRSTFLMLVLALLLPLAGCESTPDTAGRVDEEGDGEVRITQDELEPVVRFLLETKRVMVAEYVRIEMTPQFFEEKMGLTRDFRFVERKTWRTDDGVRVLQLTNKNRKQETNVDPNLLPTVYFGEGLQIRAYSGIRVIFRNPKSKSRPIFIDVVGRNATGDVKLWSSGRLVKEAPTLRIVSELFWHERKEAYKHKSSIG